MGRGPSGSRPVLDLFVEQWPLLIFVPAVLILVAVLAGVTRWWDRRDAERSTKMTAPRADHAATGHEVAARSLRTAGSRSRRRWWRRTHCTCSWHTVRTEMSEPPPGEPRQTPPHRERHVPAQPGVRGEAVLGEQVARPMAYGGARGDRQRPPASDVKPEVVAAGSTTAATTSKAESNRGVTVEPTGCRAAFSASTARSTSLPPASHPRPADSAIRAPDSRRPAECLVQARTAQRPAPTA